MDPYRPMYAIQLGAGGADLRGVLGRCCHPPWKVAASRSERRQCVIRVRKTMFQELPGVSTYDYNQR